MVSGPWPRAAIVGWRMPGGLLREKRVDVRAALGENLRSGTIQFNIEPVSGEIEVSVEPNSLSS